MKRAEKTAHAKMGLRAWNQGEREKGMNKTGKGKKNRREQKRLRMPKWGCVHGSKARKKEKKRAEKTAHAKMGLRAWRQGSLTSQLARAALI
eukprot:1138128-Pelagomonas_calceolata.AAC.2